jgi:hypothetical protein
LIALREPFRGVEFAGGKERVPRHGPDPQAAMRPLPGAVRVNEEPVRQRIAELNEAIAPVVLDVENLLDERVRVACLDAGLRAESPRGALPR